MAPTDDGSIVVRLPRLRPGRIRSCPACGFRGEGIPYFRRTGNLALLGAATLFTYAVGGVIYWILKRNERVCPSCGMAWHHSVPLGEIAVDAGVDDTGFVNLRSARNATSHDHRHSVTPPSAPSLPTAGGFRRLGGVLLGLFGLFMIGVGIVTPELAAAVIGGVIGLAGAISYGSGWKALEVRRQAVLQRMQRDVLRMARAHGGTLTASEVAAEKDLTLQAAERVLLSLDDGFRVRSDVTSDGILIFEFPEFRLGSGDPKE